MEKFWSNRNGVIFNVSCIIDLCYTNKIVCMYNLQIALIRAFQIITIIPLIFHGSLEFVVRASYFYKPKLLCYFMLVIVCCDLCFLRLMFQKCQLFLACVSVSMCKNGNLLKNLEKYECIKSKFMKYGINITTAKKAYNCKGKLWITCCLA